MPRGRAAGRPPAGGSTAFAGAALLTTLALAGCLSVPPAPPESEAPAPVESLSNAIALTRVALEGALRAAGFGLVDTARPYRPPESPLLAGAPRRVFQVVLARDPDHGFLVVYEFADPAAASAAGREMAAFLGSGPIKVQFPSDAGHVLRQVGSTLFLFTWSPSASTDPAIARAATALEPVGQGFAIPR